MKRMSYLSDITTPLIKVLRHLVTLPAHQLAGHAANLSFWRSEVDHRRQIIQSYNERFRRMRDAEQAYGKAHGFGTVRLEGFEEPELVPIRSALPARASTRDSERQELLRDLDAAFDAFCKRAASQEVIDSNRAEPVAGPNSR